ncbi:MAG TPA: universal stress protein [Terriglobia bacterium]|nr:universal stress protein [Terriglobia bacterium]
MKVLLAYDGSDCADAAVADLQKAALPDDTEFQIITVAHNGWPHVKPATASGHFESTMIPVLQEALNGADKARAAIQTRFPKWKVSSQALWGQPAEILRKTVEHAKPDLLIVGSHGRGAVGRLLLGSVSRDLVRYAPCSVRIVREGTGSHEGSLRVLLASDGSPLLHTVIGQVLKRRWPVGTAVRIVSVLPSLMPVAIAATEASASASDSELDVVRNEVDLEKSRLNHAAEYSANRLRTAGLECSVLLCGGEPGHEIVAEAKRWNADMIFIGARGLSVLDRILLGSVSTAVVMHSECPVEVVRPLKRFRE